MGHTLRRLPVRAAGIAILLLLALPPLLLSPGVPAQSAAPERPATFLVYHAAGGASPDPLATHLAPAPQTERLPYTMLDRIRKASNAPENAPGSAPAHFREIQRLLGERDLEPSTLTLRVDGEARGRTLTLRANGTPRGEDGPAHATLEVILFEHGVLVDGRRAPYVARIALAPEDVTLPGGIAREIALDPSWDISRMGAVVILRRGDQVEQSATWTVRGDAPVVQIERAVLVEHVTATWCGPCGPADDALALLAEQRGVAGPLGTSKTAVFERPGWLLYAGLGVGAALGVALVRRRTP